MPPKRSRISVDRPRLVATSRYTSAATEGLRSKVSRSTWYSPRWIAYWTCRCGAYPANSQAGDGGIGNVFSNRRRSAEPRAPTPGFARFPRIALLRPPVGRASPDGLRLRFSWTPSAPGRYYLPTALEKSLGGVTHCCSGAAAIFFCSTSPEEMLLEVHGSALARQRGHGHERPRRVRGRHDRLRRCGFPKADRLFPHRLLCPRSRRLPGGPQLHRFGPRAHGRRAPGRPAGPPLRARSKGGTVSPRSWRP